VIGSSQVKHTRLGGRGANGPKRTSVTVNYDPWSRAETIYLSVFFTNIPEALSKIKTPAKKRLLRRPLAASRNFSFVSTVYETTAILNAE